MRDCGKHSLVVAIYLYIKFKCLTVFKEPIKIIVKQKLSETLCILSIYNTEKKEKKFYHLLTYNY